jgi:hypothetical protein
MVPRVLRISVESMKMRTIHSGQLSPLSSGEQVVYCTGVGLRSVPTGRIEAVLLRIRIVSMTG